MLFYANTSHDRLKNKMKDSLNLEEQFLHVE